jgi:hypothetical protein
MNELENLFTAYRESLPDPEPSAGFTPGVWKRIDARRSPVRFLRRVTEALVALSAVTAILLGMFLIPRIQAAPVYNATYVDVLVAEQSSDTMAYAAMVHEDVPADVPNR